MGKVLKVQVLLLPSIQLYKHIRNMGIPAMLW
jgi:hypothetical protein